MTAGRQAGRPDLLGFRDGRFILFFYLFLFIFFSAAGLGAGLGLAGSPRIPATHGSQ